VYTVSRKFTPMGSVRTGKAQIRVTCSGYRFERINDKMSIWYRSQTRRKEPRRNI